MRSTFYYHPSDSIDLSRVSKIVLFQRKNLGDAALALPLIQALIVSNPTVQIVVLCSEATQFLFEQEGRVIAVSEFGLKAVSEIRTSDLCIDLHGHFNFRMIARLMKIPLVGFDDDRGWMKWLTHSVCTAKSGSRKRIFQNLDVVRRLGFQPNIEYCCQLTRNWLAVKSQSPSNLPSRYFVVHPGSRWMFKTLSEAQWKEVVGRITLDTGFTVVVTGGDSQMELDLGESLGSLDGVINLVGKTNVSELLGVIKQSSGYLGVDTFASHLASLLEIPGVVIFGPSDASVWGPIEKSPLKLFRLYSSDFNCIPCNMDGCGGGKASQCLLDIQTRELLAHYKRAIEARF